MIFMIFLHTIIFKTSQYLVAVFAFSLTCVVFSYLLLKVSSVNSVPSQSYRTAIARIYVQFYEHFFFFCVVCTKPRTHQYIRLTYLQES